MGGANGGSRQYLSTINDILVILGIIAQSMTPASPRPRHEAPAAPKPPTPSMRAQTPTTTADNAKTNCPPPNTNLSLY